LATTHVLIVDSNTLKYHLEYMFAGTGAGNSVIDFNNLDTTTLHHKTENNLLGMISDINRIKINDYIIFYLQQNTSQSIYEGKFFGIFKVVSTPFLDNNNSTQFLKAELKKSLTFRVLIEPHTVYANGITEWEALDDISSITTPNHMQWSLIYRKLKGGRGNTMITLYESDSLSQLIRNKNDRNTMNSNYFTFNSDTQRIEAIQSSGQYTGRQTNINILPRLINKYCNRLQFETHLQAYILQNISQIQIFNNENLEWIGNEVSCGVGMQRIDIMLSSIRNNNKTTIPIELKSTEAYPEITIQLQRYIDWIQQYYYPNHLSDIEPVIISRKIINKNTQEYTNLITSFESFNNFNNNINRLRYIEFDINCQTKNILFNEITY
jgi:predicted RNA-binding protein